MILLFSGKVGSCQAFFFNGISDFGQAARLFFLTSIHYTILMNDTLIFNEPPATWEHYLPLGNGR
jgi:hypothetical protein